MAYGWDLADSGVFADGGVVVRTTSSTPANHVVADARHGANGLSSIAAGTVHTSPAAHDVMQPFPIVRLVGIDYDYGTRITQLAVEAPAGARITVQCQGRGCPAKLVRHGIPARTAGKRWVKFPRFDRLLRPRAVLRIRVSKGGEVGAYTRFAIRRNGIPSRVDTCLNVAGDKPIACPQ